MMGKLSGTTGIEVIPLDTNDPLQRQKMQGIPYLADPTIVPRVQKVRKGKHRRLVSTFSNFSTWKLTWIKLMLI